MLSNPLPRLTGRRRRPRPRKTAAYPPPVEATEGPTDEALPAVDTQPTPGFPGGMPPLTPGVVERDRLSFVPTAPELAERRHSMNGVAREQHGRSERLGVCVEPMRLLKVNAVTRDQRLEGREWVLDAQGERVAQRVFTQPIEAFLDFYPRAGTFMVRTTNGIIYNCECERPEVIRLIARLTRGEAL